MSEGFCWISVGDALVCGDCNDRSGAILTLEEWEANGTPGTGATICSADCRCLLMGSGIFERVSGVKIETITDSNGYTRLSPNTMRKAGLSAPIQPLTASTQARLTELGREDLLDMDSGDLHAYLAEYLDSEMPGLDHNLMSINQMIELMETL